MTVQIDGDGNHHIAGRDLHHETHQHFYVEHCINVICRVPLVQNEKGYCYACQAQKDREEAIGYVTMLLIGSVFVLWGNASFAEFIGLGEYANTIALMLYPFECAFIIWIWVKST